MDAHPYRQYLPGYTALSTTENVFWKGSGKREAQCGLSGIQANRNGHV